MINFNWYRFSELTVEQLYSVLVLRCNVFVVEQNCAYQDVDGKDPYALHLLGMENNSLICYLRLFLPSNLEKSIIFGRVVAEKSARTRGYGKKLIQELLTYCDANYPGIIIKCAAQHYLTRFYEQFGFKRHGDTYEEDGILHIEMQRDP